MQIVLKMKDSFMITGRGRIFLVDIWPKGADCKLGDIFCDRAGHCFKLSGIEMIRRESPEEVNSEDLSKGFVFENLDHKAPVGNTFVSGEYKLNWIFCNHPLYQRRPDDDYAEEYRICSEKADTVLFSYEDLELGKLSLYCGEISGLTAYRGWMMKPKMYRLFYELLLKRGIILINDPQEYEFCHLLPNWYGKIYPETPESHWTDTSRFDDAVQLLNELEGPAIVKDYVKSRKHEWYEACFIEDVHTDKAEQVIQNFIERQNTDLVGGIVLRKFIDLKTIGYHEKSGMPISEEYRIFVLGGIILCAGGYWTDEQKLCLSDEEIRWVQSIIPKVKSEFFTIDLARCSDGKLVVMELGDGQVSGLQQMTAEEFYAGL